MVGKPKRTLLQELALTDVQPPEIRTLIHEYGYDVVMTAIATGNTRDPEKIMRFAEANRRAGQDQLSRITIDPGEFVARMRQTT